MNQNSGPVSRAEKPSSGRAAGKSFLPPIIDCPWCEVRQVCTETESADSPEPYHAMGSQDERLQNDAGEQHYRDSALTSVIAATLESSSLGIENAPELADRFMKIDPVKILNRHPSLYRVALLATSLSCAGALLSAVMTRRPKRRLFFLLVAALLAGEYVGMRCSVDRDPNKLRRIS
jgi:hypothetical protein